MIQGIRAEKYSIGQRRVKLKNWSYTLREKILENDATKFEAFLNQKYKFLPPIIVEIFFYLRLGRRNRTDYWPTQGNIPSPWKVCTQALHFQCPLIIRMILIPANDVESNQALSKWPRDEVEGLAQLAVDAPSAGQATFVVPEIKVSDSDNQIINTLHLAMLHGKPHFPPFLLERAKGKTSKQDKLKTCSSNKNLSGKWLIHISVQNSHSKLMNLIVNLF